MAAWARKFHADHGRLAGTRYPGEGRDRAERAAAPAGRPLQRRAMVEARPVVPAVRSADPAPRRTSPTGTPSVRWDDIQPPWLREGDKFYTYLQLESGQLTWSTVLRGARVRRPVQRVRPLPRASATPPWRTIPSQLRAVVLEFRAFLRQWRRERPAHGQARGGPLDARSVARTLRFLGNFYATMNDCRADAAAATGDDGWLALTDSHARLVRRDELAAERAIRQADERNYISDADLSRMLAVRRAARPAPRPGHDHHPRRRRRPRWPGWASPR